MKFRIALSALSMVLGLLTTAPARAERAGNDEPLPQGYVSIYLGATMSDEEGLYLNRPAAGESSFRLTDYRGRMISFRFGRWQKRTPWFGMATDFSYHETSSASGEIDFSVMTVSPMFFLRIPIGRNRENPDGLFSAYAGIGPTLNRIHLSANIQPELSQPIDDIEFTVGYQWAIGGRWELFDGMALVAEYRFSADDFSISEFEGSACVVCPDVLSGEARLDTHHFMVGVSFPL